MRDFGFGRRSPKLEDIIADYIRDFVDLLNANLRSHIAYDDVSYMIFDKKRLVNWVWKVSGATRH